MVIVHNIIKLKTVSLKQYNVTDSDDSFKKLGEFILMSFFKNIRKPRIPEDMRRLLDLLLGQSPSGKERLIRNHISLMTERGVSWFICSWHNLQDQHTLNQKAAYQRACSGLPYTTNWQNLIKGNDPFIFTLAKSKYLGDPRDQPRFFRNCLQHILTECFRGKNDQMTRKPNFEDRHVVKMLISIFYKSVAIFPELLETEGLLKISRPEECFY
ncbi:hypothetical protein vseg_011899 [Gypsophila vaccaria]